MDNLSIFVDCLKEYMAQNGLSINKFAQKTGVAERAVSKWICGTYFPSIDCVKKVAVELDCSTDYLFGMSERKMSCPSLSGKAFIDKFNKACADKKVTAYKVAKECGFGESMISKWKKGKSPKTETLIKLANYFGFSLDYFIF